MREKPSQRQANTWPLIEQMNEQRNKLCIDQGPVIYRFSNSESHRPGGFTIEFYQAFKGKLVLSLLKQLKEKNPSKFFCELLLS